MPTVEEILKKIISIPSFYPFEKPLIEWIENFLKERHFSIKRIQVDQRYEIVATKGKSIHSLLLFGHADTVPIQSLENLDPHHPQNLQHLLLKAQELGWKENPFAGYVAEKRMYGLGSYDMKAGIAAILKIADSLPTSWYEQNKLKIAIVVAEENMSEGIYYLLQTDIFRDVQAAVSTEILDTATRTMNPEPPGVETLLLGRRGRVAFELTVKGKAAHAATPQLGINAIEEVARVISAVKTGIANNIIPLPSHEILSYGSLTPLAIHAGTSSLSIPSSCKIIFDRHIVPPETPDLVLTQFTSFLNTIVPPIQYEISLFQRKVPYLMPFVTDKNTKVVKLAIEAVTHIKGHYILDGGNSVADENMFASPLYSEPLRHHIPTIVMGCQGDNFHKENEWVNIDSLHELVTVLEEFCRLWALNNENQA